MILIAAMETFGGAPKKQRAEFIPGRPEGEPVAERVYTQNDGGVNIHEHRYQMRSGEYVGPEQVLSPEDIDELKQAGLEGNTSTIDSRHPAYASLEAILNRNKSAETTPAETKDALDSTPNPEQLKEDFKNALVGLTAAQRGLQQQHQETANINLQKTTLEKEAEGLLKQVSEEVKKQKEENPDKDGDNKDKDTDTKEPKKDEPKKPAGEAKHAAHESHGHGHGEPWHLPRNISEWGWLGAAVGVGLWEAAKFFFKNIGMPLAHSVGYIISGDAKHPWQTLFKRTGTIFHTAFSGFLKKKGGSSHGSDHGGGHGGGGHH